MSDQLPLTVVVPALNEEANLAAALASVAFAGRTIVVDSGSVDRTSELAAAAGAEIVSFRYEPGGPKKKAWALAHLDFRTDWVFLLDADERVPEGLRTEIERVVRNDELDGWYVDRELIFMHRVMRSFQPNWNMRLFRHERARMEDLGLHDLPAMGDNEIHEHVTVSGRLGYLQTPLQHEDYRELSAWLDRHNKYATWEAHLYRRFREEPIGAGPVELLRMDPFRRKRVLRRIWVRLPFRPAIRFVVWYVLRRGFRDGRQGFVFCALMAWYEFIIGVKLRELRQADIR